MENEVVKKESNWSKLIIGIIIGILLFGIVYYFFLRDDNSDKKQKDGQKDEQKEMSSAWFKEYLEPFMQMKTMDQKQGIIDVENATRSEIFNTSVNLAVNKNSGSFKKVGDNYYIPQDLVASYAEKYFGVDKFVYSEANDQLKYNSTEKAYVSTLEFGIGEEAAPGVEYSVSNIVYNDNKVTLRISLEPNDEVVSNPYDVYLTCQRETCVIDKLIEITQ